ncbi:unnamed protein product, partial [Urochloa humidicola]
GEHGRTDARRVRAGRGAWAWSVSAASARHGRAEGGEASARRGEWACSTASGVVGRRVGHGQEEGELGATERRLACTRGVWELGVRRDRSTTRPGGGRRGWHVTRPGGGR